VWIRRIGSRYPTDHHRGVAMSTFEDEQNPSRYQPIVADMLTNIERIRHAAERSSAAPGRVELSERELEVLRYLPSMLTAGEIAAELYVSVNTVKAHLKSLYRKLEVSSRRAAVRRARELNLLAQSAETTGRQRS